MVGLANQFIEGTRLAGYELVQDIRRVASDLGRTPTAKEYDDLGDYSRHPIRRHFGTWNEAVRASGLEVNKEHGLPDDRLLQDLRLVALDLGWTPSVREYAEHGNHAPFTIFEHFDGWDDALEKAGLDLKGKRPTDPLEALSPEDVGLSPIGERGSA